MFFGPPAKDLPRAPHEPTHFMRVPVELLVLACVVVGVFESRKLTLPAELLDNISGGYISDIVRRGDMEGKEWTKQELLEQDLELP